MTSHSLVPQTSGLSLPVAQMRSVFHPGDVERRLARLQEAGSQREYENLRAVYERMLERGPERFQVKPSGVPDMAPLYEHLPNFAEVLDDVKRHVALAQDSRDGLEVTPMLLLGPPGLGKTHFARQLAELLGTGMNLVPMSSMTAGWLLSGASSQWKGARPGKVFEALVEGEYANPVIVVDEIDKASGDAQYDPISAFIKSVRGSDPDAALYWLAKMLAAGEDPRFILRRLLVLAGEAAALNVDEKTANVV